jgi:aminoglycoside phosphotransferase (APT) family kinase protein
MPSLNLLPDISRGIIELIQTIQRYPEFGAGLDELRGEWRVDAFVHFDLRWDNILVTRGRRAEVKIVDWEFAGAGDACWDVGTVFSNYLTTWVRSIPLLGESLPERLVEQARLPLSKMQPAIRAFWSSYCGGRRFDILTANDHLLRATKFSAARLLETVYGESQTSLRLSAHAMYLVQLSLNILKNPHAATVHLLGIPFGDTR